MKPEGALIAERIVARHCPELVRASPDPEELLPLLNRAGETLARGLVPALAPLTGGKGLTCKAKPARRCDLDELTMFNPELGAHILLGLGADALPMLCIVDAAAVLRMVDRTFGGRGEAPSPLPDEFPLSADLMVLRIEDLLVRALEEAFQVGPGGLVGLDRSCRLAGLAPLPSRDALVALEFDLREPGGDTWLLTLALPLPTVTGLYGAAPQMRPPAPSPEAQFEMATAGTFASLPLALAAELVSMKVPLSLLAALEVGSVLPVSVARSVPLKVGRLTVATGTVGATDDRVALQITSAFNAS